MHEIDADTEIATPSIKMFRAATSLPESSRRDYTTKATQNTYVICVTGCLGWKELALTQP